MILSSPAACCVSGLMVVITHEAPLPALSSHHNGLSGRSTWDQITDIPQQVSPAALAYCLGISRWRPSSALHSLPGQQWPYCKHMEEWELSMLYVVK